MKTNHSRRERLYIVFWVLILEVLVPCALAAPQADLVEQLPGQPLVDFKQYAGYVTINESAGRAFFYYFVEAEYDKGEKPLILWLNGGPGCSSVAGGAFTELGPFFPDAYGTGLDHNSHAWNKEANLLFLESPVGVGWSYSNSSSDYVNQTDVKTADDNLNFLLNWFEKFPEYKNRDFYLTGESYAGHYIPQLAALVMEHNKSLKSSFLFNFKGIAIGNPLIRFDVDTQAIYDYLWSHGLISEELYNTIVRECVFADYSYGGNHNQDDACNEALSDSYDQKGRYINPYDVLVDICLPPTFAEEFTLRQKLRHKSLGIDVCIGDEMIKYLNLPAVQKALHANTTGLTYPYSQCSGVSTYDGFQLEIDIVPVLTGLLQSGLRLWIYSGDADQVVPFLGTRQNVDVLIETLNLKHTVNYTAWYENKQVAGWTYAAGNLTFATIRGAAHMVPQTQPARSLLMFKHFLSGDPLPTTPNNTG